MSVSNEDIQCPQCAKYFAPTGLRKHVQKVHDFTGEMWRKFMAGKKEATLLAKGAQFEKCAMCGNVFADKSKLARHSKTKHSAGEVDCSEESVEDAELTAPMCCLCDMSFKDHQSLSEHCMVLHAEDGAEGRPQDYAVYDVVFPDFGRFQTWRDDMCNKHCTSFFRRSSKENGAKTYWRCNRAGKQESHGEKRVVQSKKYHKYCPAFLNVKIQKDGSVHAKGSFGHLGHDISHALLRWTDDQELLLTSMLEDMPPLDRQVRVCMLYEFKLGNEADLAFLNVNRAFGDSTVTNTIVHRWFAKFQKGDESLDKEPGVDYDKEFVDDVVEDPEAVEARLAREYGVQPGTLYLHLDALGRGEKLRDFSSPNCLCIGYCTCDKNDGTSLNEVLESEIFIGNGYASSSRDEGTVKLESDATQNGHHAGYNKVRIRDNGLEFRNTLQSPSTARFQVRPEIRHPVRPVPQLKRAAPGGSGIIARSLACLAKYRTDTHQNHEAARITPGTSEPVKPPRIEEPTSITSQVKTERTEPIRISRRVEDTRLFSASPKAVAKAIPIETKKRVVSSKSKQLTGDCEEMKEHIVPLF
ncbi:hypothetical protein Q1695_016322 [Nippostrongylus brasiliensis]|nr:hypothetical protein Q1695_016322 [Nippostrongylus brasiliensis]